MSPTAERLLFTDRRAARLRSLREFARRWWWALVAFWLVRLLWLVTRHG